METLALPIADKILKALKEGLITRYEWKGVTADGRETACLLATFAPECGVTKSPSAYTDGELPNWFIDVIPWINDKGSVNKWPEMIKTFAAALDRWRNSTPADWERRCVQIRDIATIDQRCETTPISQALPVDELRTAASAAWEAAYLEALEYQNSSVAIRSGDKALESAVDRMTASILALE